jgi:hypothetical protein
MKKKTTYRAFEVSLRALMAVIILVAGFCSAALAGSPEIEKPSNRQLLHQERYAMSAAAAPAKSTERIAKPDLVISLVSSALSCHHHTPRSEREPLDRPKIVTGYLLTQFTSSAL